MKKFSVIFVIFFLIVSGKSFGQSFKIAVLGDSRSDGETGSDGLNKEVLAKLCGMIKPYNPQAVFFTGDLTLGLEKEDEEDSTDIKNTTKEEDIYGNHWSKSGFVYNSKAFIKQLNAFSGVLKDNLGSIPFYPLIGNHEAVGPDAISIFKDHFSITNIAPIDSMHLAYYVEVNNALFVLMATDYYSRKDNFLVEHKLSAEQVKWLDSLLSAESKFKYKFVLGHEPGYSVRGIKNNTPVGLDKHPEARDVFWNILKKNGVNAYLCAHEHLYNRSVSDSLLQIVSGGAGAPLEKGTEEAFYHFMIMEFTGNSAPKVTVIDINGKIRDEFIIQ